MRTSPRKLILLEMNEVPFRVLDDFAARHPGSAVAQVMAKSAQFNTVCEDQLELDPWISWPTLHRGVIDEQHGIRHLGQSLERADARYPPIWELLARGGRSAGTARAFQRRSTTTLFTCRISLPTRPSRIRPSCSRSSASTW
jgi:hypothetical protein